MRSTPPNFKDRWDKVLKDTNTLTTDVMGSFGEDFLNEFLKTHFKNNHGNSKDRTYHIKIERTFDDHGTGRTFTVTLAIDKPLVIELPPLSKSGPFASEFQDRRGWIQLPSVQTGRGFRALATGGTPAVVRLVAPQIAVRFKWPKLQGGGDWEFPEDGPLLLWALIEAELELRSTKPDPAQPEVQQTLRIQVRSIKFQETSKLIWKTLVPSYVAALSDAERKLWRADEQKFKDLIIIAMNIAATEYGPKLVQNIPLPTPMIQKRKLYPSLFDAGDKILTLGFSLDLPAYIADTRAAITKNIKTFEALVELDLADLGGMEGLVRAQETGRKQSFSKLFPRSSAFSRSLEMRARPVRAAKLRASAPNVAVAVDEFLLDALAADALPAPHEDCTGWATALVLRGRICYWVRLFDADVLVASPANVTGAVHVDVGGAVEGCIKKFWDCSWNWACLRLSLSVVGVPAIELSLKSGDGLIFTAQLRGKVTLDSNLPEPLDWVIGQLGNLVWEFIKVFLNSVIAQIEFKIVPPEIELKDEKVKIKLSGFVPAFYSRPNVAAPNYPESRRRFLSCLIHADPK